MTGVDVAFWVFSAAAVLFGWRVFRTDSMVRASFALLASFLNVAAILVLLLAEYLGVALVFMMALEMTVMALFMVAFMMNPAGLNPMQMVHRHGVAIGLGVAAAVGLGAVALLGRFPRQPRIDASGTIEALGAELLGGSMLVFESAGIALLATMVGAVILSARSSRTGAPADQGSHPPPIVPGDDATIAEVGRTGGGHGGHHHHHHQPRGHRHGGHT